jgi:hypothetical protein
LIGGEIARVLKLQIPELVYANLDEAFGRTEADEEIQDLLQGQGLNLALHFLSGAINFDPVVTVVDSKRLPNCMARCFYHCRPNVQKHQYVNMA